MPLCESKSLSVYPVQIPVIPRLSYPMIVLNQILKVIKVKYLMSILTSIDTWAVAMNICWPFHVNEDIFAPPVTRSG